MFTGMLFTAFSAVRSNKYLMYALAIGVFILVLLWSLRSFGNRREKEGAMKVAAAAAKTVIKNMETYREIDAEIKHMPLSQRAARLRRTDRSAD